ncbi:YcdB/YcdC domain-containing protein [Solibacillus sp. CAU 1738]|uniref:YcdB/YcdC domain-containing protein n=1 Tax=Solibacillus sp. CAU 1738 TaxID=3140363 RepID=UPI003260D1A9
MVKIRKFGYLISASALSLSLLAPVGHASMATNEPQDKIKIHVASTTTEVTKNDLIKRFHELFPNKFNFLTNNDFNMNSGLYYPEDEELRYSLSFSKTINGQPLYGHVSFYGENLELQYFSFEPQNKEDALFPAKVSKNEAEKIATNYIKQLFNSTDYQLDTDSYDYYGYYSNQILTEPIRYTFSFVRTKNGVAIADDRANITILGNGEIIDFYRQTDSPKSSTYDEVNKVKDKNESLQKFKDNLTVELQYQIDTNYRTGKTDVQLVYQPSITYSGIHAISGEWLVNNGFASTFPKRTAVEKLVASPLQPKFNNITVEEAKKIAEQLLSIESDKVKLQIQGVDEYENANGQAIISISYMYSYKHGGYGASLEFDKKTGDIIQYYDAKGSLLEQLGENPTTEKAISADEAEAKAISYVKDLMPSKLHDYAKPMTEPYFDEQYNGGMYHFSFPRIVNGIVVSGDYISVSLAADGSLSSLSNNYQKIEKWPSIDQVVSNDAAKNMYKDALDLKLNYVKQPNKEDKHHYDLVYLPVINGKMGSTLNASTGQWSSASENNTVDVAHDWAKEELNYLINNNILEVKDVKSFNANASVTKGEALKTLIKSLTYFYEGDFNYNSEGMNEPYGNIDPKHPLYPVVQRAIAIGILDLAGESFNPDSPLTREELAAWQVRILGLEHAAKYTDLYKLSLQDANKITSKYTGHVALSNAMGLLKADNNHFYPDREVTYAELAVSTISLAYELAKKGSYLRY